jgi:hypothetical protein
MGVTPSLSKKARKKTITLRSGGHGRELAIVEVGDMI